jgi:hypothetical protein
LSLGLLLLVMTSRPTGSGLHVENHVAELHNIYAAPATAPGKNFNVAPAQAKAQALTALTLPKTCCSGTEVVDVQYW